MVILVEGSDLSIVTRQGLAIIFEGACSDSINFEEILSHARGNFEDQNKVLEFSIIIINCCIIRPIINAYYNYIV
jgi:hypothetical protein